MADASTPLDQQALDIQAGLLNLTLQFRRYRRGEFRFEPRDAVVFEDTLVEVSARFAQFVSSVNSDLAMCSKALSEAVELLERYRPGKDVPAPAHEPSPSDLPTNVVILPVVRRSRGDQPC